MPADPPDSMLPPMELFARWVRNAERILFITGAGLSADSGLPTYRGVGGLYDDADTEEGLEIEQVLSGEMMHRRPALCWKYIAQVEQTCRGAEPNAGHEAMALLDDHCEHVVVLTQNVDGLHRAAGSETVIEMHGNLHRLHCTRCSWETTVTDYDELTIPPACPRCDALVRPAVVLFGEMLPSSAMQRLEAELRRGFSLVVTVGTTAVFPYIAAPVQMAGTWGAKTVEINPGHSAVSGIVDLHIPARAAPTLGALVAALGYG